MVHASHLAVIHAGHAAVVHASHLAVIHAGHAAVVRASHLAVIHAGHAAVVRASHFAVIHAGHAAVVHAHIIHGNEGAWVNGWNSSLQAFTDGQGAPGKARTVHGLSEDGVCLFVFWLNNDIVGFGYCDTELVDRDRMDILPIRCNHCHFQARNAYIEIRHGGAVDEPKPDFLARLENTRPISIRSLAVHEVGVGIPAHIREISGAHLHLGPHLAIGHRSRPAHFAYVVDEVTHGPLVEVVVVRLLLKLG